MYPMLRIPLKAPVTRAITPLCRIALRIGLTPNLVTVLGTLGVATSALIFYPNGNLFWGTLVICFFALTDLFDGTMARLSNTGPSRWGALLDATMDRISDAAIIIGLLLYTLKSDELSTQSLLLAVSLVAGFLVSYIKAKAESLDIECEGGFAERTERLIIVLATAGFTGLNVPHALVIGLALLSFASVVTVVQRLVIVFRSHNSHERY
jgi:CDP-diacylglycerol--glycerol-3-phosphate 3-phosphatidyltransferase